MNEITTVAAEQNAVLALIERASSNAEIDVAKMNALLDFQFRIMDRQAEISFNKDFALASKEMPRIEKRGVINLGKGSITFAKYGDLHKIIKPIEQKYGFIRSFTTSPNPNGIEVTVTLSHRDGHSRSSTRLMPPDAGAGRNAMQAIGSASSYAKRYLTLDIWDIITEDADDDGTASGAISDAQVREIEELIIDTNSDKKKLLSVFNVQSISAIQKQDFAGVMSLLRQKARRG